LKILFAFLLSITLLIGSSVPVEAHTMSNETLIAGHRLAEVIDLIMTRYVGDPVSINELVEAAIRGMTNILDQYSVFLSQEELLQFTTNMSGRLVGVGISMLVREDGRTEVARILPNSPAAAAGILPGDIITNIDGENVDGVPLDIIAGLITNPDNERVIMTFARGDRSVTFDILKAEIVSPTVIVDRLEDVPEAQGLNVALHNFRYLQLSSISLTTGEDVRRALGQMQAEGVRGFILDLRGNTGGYLDVTVDIANQLVPAGVVLQTVNQTGRRRTYSSTLNEVPFDNIVILVNRFTASAAEVIASALQDSGVGVVVGETTFGKGTVQTLHRAPIGGALKLTTEEYFRRNGDPIDGVGVTPCIEVERRQNPNEIDPVLRRGLERLLLGR